MSMNDIQLQMAADENQALLNRIASTIPLKFYPAEATADGICDAISAMCAELNEKNNEVLARRIVELTGEASKHLAQVEVAQAAMQAAVRTAEYQQVTNRQLNKFVNERNLALEQRDNMLAALVALLDNYCPLTGNPTHAELVQHWVYEKSQGRGDADIHLAALAAVASVKGGA